MAVLPEVMTADDLLQLPDDGFRYELVQGELRRMSPARHQHGYLVVNITAPLAQYVRTHRLGRVYAAETGFRIATNPDTVRAPDVAFVSAERLQQAVNREGYWPGPPDLAIEVVSPNDLYTEVVEKVVSWLDAGTKMVVIVNPRQLLVTVYRSLAAVTVLTTADQLDGADVVPGWSLAVQEIFE